ncbi:MAG: ribose-5-phosphate isomerase RpiA, partial [Rhodothermales bacterium]
MSEAAKQAAGKRAAALVESGMKVGLGTGSTAAVMIEELGRRIREEGLKIVGTPTSMSAERLARAAGIQLVTLDELDELDLAIDGADEIDPDLNLIKGRGAAHTREKVVASMARRFVIVANEEKLVDRLGSKATVPVEVLPMAAHPVAIALRKLGAVIELRMGKAKDGPVVTDQGMWILDAAFSGIDGPEELDRDIKLLPGVLDHGLF